MINIAGEQGDTLKVGEKVDLNSFVSERKIISEDVYSMLEYHSCVEKVVILPEMLYFHRINKKSLTHTFRTDRIAKLDYFYEELIILCNRLGYDVEVHQLLAEPYFNGMIGALKQVAQSEMGAIQKLNIFRMVCHSDTTSKASANLNLRNVSFLRKVLLKSIQKKLYLFCFLLVWFKK